MPDFNVDDLKKDSEQERQINSNTMSLAEVRNLCANMAKQEEIIKNLENQLKIEKEFYDKYSEEIIPDALTQIGLKDLTLTDGTVIGLAQTVATSITEEKKPAAHQWLRDNELGDIIKNQVVVSFGKDEDADADKLIGMITAEGANGNVSFGDIDRQEKVNPQTLKAFVKQRVAEGLPIPADLFSIYLGEKAVVKKGKKK